MTAKKRLNSLDNRETGHILIRRNLELDADGRSQAPVIDCSTAEPSKVMNATSNQQEQELEAYFAG
jgi:hypothetical protein